MGTSDCHGWQCSDTQDAWPVWPSSGSGPTAWRTCLFDGAPCWPSGLSWRWCFDDAVSMGMGRDSGVCPSTPLERGEVWSGPNRPLTPKANDTDDIPLCSQRAGRSIWRGTWISTTGSSWPSSSDCHLGRMVPGLSSSHQAGSSRILGRNRPGSSSEKDEPWRLASTCAAEPCAF